MSMMLIFPVYFEDGESKCIGIIQAVSGTTKIAATFQLERKTSSGRVHEKSWNKSSSTKTLSFSETDAVSLEYTYRLSETADVTRNGVTETVTTLMDERINLSNGCFEERINRDLII